MERAVSGNLAGRMTPEVLPRLGGSRGHSFLRLLITLGWTLALAAAPALARDPVADEFDTLASQLQNPPSAAWLNYAYSQDYMPKAPDRDPVDVLLRRTTTILGEFNTNGLLDTVAVQLAALAQQNTNIPVSSRSERLDLFRRVESASRQAAFANPLINFRDILFLKRQPANYNHMVDQFFGFHAVLGGGIFVLENAFSGNPAARDVLANAVCENGRFLGQKLNFGSFLAPALSYDGKTIYFCHTEAAQPTYQWTEHSTFHIFRVNVDGTGLRQLTDGPVNDLFPWPLPNGRLVFVSERRGGFGRCHERLCPTYTLHTMNPDGTDITLLSAHETNEWQPSVDNNGMVVYTRWDYVDRGDDQAHHPWITYPDGRDARALQGNWKAYYSDSPYMEMDVRAIPGSHKYVTTAAAHHGQSFGSFVLIDPRLYDDNKMSPLKVLTPEAQFPEATTGATTDWKFATAWALSERFYLCGYSPTASTLAITLMDAKTGLKTVLYHDPAITCEYPTPLIARTPPPLIPHRVASGKPLAPGQVFDPAVYAGMPTNGTVALMNVYDSTLSFPAGSVIRYLRIYEVLPKTTWHHTNPHMGYAQEKSGRRVLGTVPVESDGSAYFTLPADTPVFFQALDANKEAVQSMRSLTYVKPGEQLICGGCHEPRGNAPMMSTQPTAVQRPPSAITPEVAGSSPFSYPLLVQPVLDANCVSCHQAQGAIDLSAGTYSTNFNYWYNSYLNLANYAFYYGAYANAGYDRWNTPTSIPGQVGAKGSRLYQVLFVTNHHDLQLTTEARHRLALWLDSNSDFFGAYENTLAQAQGQVVQPIDPRITGYQTVTNTVYGPAIPLTPTNAFSNLAGMSVYGTPLKVAAVRASGAMDAPVTLGYQTEAGLDPATVDAGSDLLAYVSGPPAALQGTVLINGQPPVPGTVLTWWSQVSGPTNAAIGNIHNLSTTATFSQPGSYVLRLSAFNGVVTNSDDLLVTALPASQAPMADAGPDQVLRPGQTNTTLAGRVLAANATPAAQWTQVSGPAAATFDTPTRPATGVRFPAPGTYLLRLTASDSLASASDDCSIRVSASISNSAPVISAGPDIATSYTNNPITLNGSASDDGLPAPLTVSWKLLSGPGTVTFGNSNAPVTTANFSQFGSYLLQLTGSDGDRTAYDQLSVFLYPGDGSLSFGSITREYWYNLAGNSISTLTSYSNYPAKPDATITLASFQSPQNVADSYGSRMHGFLCPPATGTYRFWLASDDNGELWLSTNSTTAGARLIASVTGWSDPLQWNKFPSQQSADITLQAGQVYYIMALQKEGGGGDHMAVAWQGPTISQAVIDGQYLAPYPQAVPARGTVTRQYWTNISGNAVADLTQSPNYPSAPNGTQILTAFEGPTNWMDNYGTRIQALLYPPTNGNYQFWIASDDNSELWLSTNASATKASLIASVPVWTGVREWTKYPSQASASFYLQSNQMYYIQALQKEGGGGDNLAVAWQGPGITRQVIAGQYLSDYVETVPWRPPPSAGMVLLDPNTAPRVSAGPDQETPLGVTNVTLRGDVVDDGLPAIPGAVTIRWTQAGGPGTVTFSDPNSAFTTAYFSQPGLYLLRLSATDGELSGSASVSVNVRSYAEYDFVYPSPQELAFSPNGRLLAVSDAGLNRVVLMDPATRTRLNSLPVQGVPRGLAWETTNLLWVCEYDAGTVARIDVAQAKVNRRLTVGPKPYDVKFDPVRQRLVVADFGLAQVAVLDLASGATLATMPAVAQPMQIAFTPDYAMALVANSQPAGDARALDHAAEVTLVDLNTFAVSSIKLPTGSTAVRGIAVSADGRWAYVAHLLGRTYLPTTQLNNGWILNNSVTVLNLTNRQVYATIPLDAYEEGAANPWGLAVSTNGQSLFVAAAGVHELVRLDWGSLQTYIATNPPARAWLDSDLVTLYQNNWICRQPLQAKGPRGLALSPDGRTLAVAAYFSGEVHFLDATNRAVNDAVATGPGAPEHALRRGERLYNDGDGCYQRWLTCATCHPGARSDGLNWDLVNDGIGNTKNTLSHVYSTETPPSMSTGVRASVMVAIQAGFKFIQFQQRSDQEMQDVYDYMASLRPERSPTLNKQWLTAAAMRGRAIFRDPVVGCANCHNGPYYTDKQLRNVGTGHPADVGPRDPIYDTPALHELWRSGPYLHDGSAATLRDVILTQNSNQLHGVTAQLTSSQVDDLVAYLQQIGGAEDWVNTPPLVDAGTNQLLTLPAGTAQLAATAQDDGLPSGALNLTWSVQSGPAPVLFGSTNAPVTTATFAVAGDYTLACRADDGELAATNTVAIAVRPVGSPADSNANGLPDFWELYYFGGLNVAKGGPNEDYDGDGLSNLYEYLTGTDPTDPNSGFHLRIARVGGQTVVRFPAYAAGTALTPGRRFFTLQTATSIGSPTAWSNVPGFTDVLGADQIVEWSGPPSADLQLFRVQIRLEP